MSFVVYRSSAGSGKTTTLVSSFLKLCLTNNNAFRNILAITFTNKAAGEMKERIIQALKELSDKENTNIRLMKEVCTHFNESETVMRERSRLILRNILHNYSDFAVSTIDSFNHRLIRSFTFEAGLASGFNILLNSSELSEQAIDMLINEYGNDAELSATFDSFIMQAIAEERGFDIVRSIGDVAREIFNENAKPYISLMKDVDFKTINDCNKSTYTSLKRLKKEISDACSKLHKTLNDNNISDTELYQGKRGLWGFLNKILSLDDFSDMNSYTRDTLENNRWYGKSAKEFAKTAIDGISDELNLYGGEILSVFQRNHPIIKLLEIIRKNLIFLAVFNRLRFWADTLSKEQNKLPVADFNTIISKAISDEYAPFIYEKIGNRYHNYLLDEFQDTSLLQWQNLIPLIENSLADGKFSMVVGDGKQSIYRWRGGKVEQFTSLPGIFQKPQGRVWDEREDTLKRFYIAENLASNWRSKSEIVDFNNRLFNHISQYLDNDNKKVYEGHEQIFDKSKTGGLVEVKFIEKTAGMKSEDTNLLHIDETLRIIDEYIESGHSYSSIAILCRSGAQIRMLANALTEKGIPLISPDSLLLHTSKAVNFMLSYLRLIDNPADITARRAIEIFIETNIHHHFPPLEIPKEADKLPLYELCELISQKFQLKKYFSPFIQYFLDIVLEYQLKTNQGIKAFIPYWEENKESFSIELPEGIDAVKLMTIHKAKGLQFSAVIFPFADEDSRPKNNSRMWIPFDADICSEIKAINVRISGELEGTEAAEVYQREISLHCLDTVNVMYVALTRPVNALHIVCTLDDKKLETGGNVSINKLLFSFLQEHPEWLTDEFHYRIGTEQKAPPTEKQEEECGDLPPDSYMAGQWKTNMRIAAVKYDNSSPSVLWGNIVHKALSAINTSEDIDTVCKRLKVAGEIDEDQSEKLKKVLLNSVNHPLLQDFFSGKYKVYSEREILIPDSPSQRPDKVIFYRQNRAGVLDFKTGRYEPSHEEQMKNYIMTLREMNYSDVSGLIAYLSDEMNIIEINE